MNKKKLKLFSMIILTILLLTIGNTAKATIENKPGGTVYTNVTVSESYQKCYDMRSETYSSLGTNSLDPHLTTNADWGAAVYLGVSVYGSVRSSTGTSVTIDGTSYKSTTNNITGVMNMGSHLTQTASLITGFKDTGKIANLKNSIENKNKYVETLGKNAADSTNKGRALGETSGWYDSSKVYPTTDYPVGIRTGFLGFYTGYSYGSVGSGRCLFRYYI